MTARADVPPAIYWPSKEFMLRKKADETKHIWEEEEEEEAPSAVWRRQGPPTVYSTARVRHGDTSSQIQPVPHKEEPHDVNFIL